MTSRVKSSASIARSAVEPGRSTSSRFGWSCVTATDASPDRRPTPSCFRGGAEVWVDVGSELSPWCLESVSAEKMKTMAALIRDPNPIHWDLVAVEGLGMGCRAVNQGPNNMAYVVNMLTAWCGDPAAIRRVSV